MKKLLLIISLLLFIDNIYASCTYSEQKDYNALATYVTTDYTYNYNGTFNLTFYNLGNNLKVNYNNTYLIVNNGSSTIYNLSEGTSIKAFIYSNTSICSYEKLRVMNITLPYLNEYYNSEECIGYEELSICNHEFLDYKLSENTFNKLIKSSIVKKETEEEVVEVSFWDKILNILKEYGIKVGLVLFTSFVSFAICNSKLRKLKHGI